jgi:hypothetical protein
LVTITEVKAVRDGAELQGGSQVARREEPSTPLGDRPVPHARVGNVQVQVLALVRYGDHGFDDRGEMMPGQNRLGRALEEVASHVRVAELAQHNGQHD